MYLTALPSTASTTQKNPANAKTATMTTVVVDWTSFHEGVTTLRISERTSRRKSRLRVKTLRARLGTPCSILVIAAFAIILFFFSALFSVTGIAALLLKFWWNWQGRRDSNPQVRFWRPAV